MTWDIFMQVVVCFALWGISNLFLLIGWNSQKNFNLYGGLALSTGTWLVIMILSIANVVWGN